MGRVVKCPRCQANLEVGNMAPGSSVRCSECGGMARIPSGRTGVNPAVQAPVAAPPPPAKKETGTRTRVRPVSSTGMRAVRPAPRKSSNTGLVVGLVVGLVAVVIVLVVVLAGSKPPPAETARKPPPKGSGSSGGGGMGMPLMPAPPVPAPTPVPVTPIPVPVAPRVEEPSKARWDDLMIALRAGGGFEDLSRPEGVAFKRVKDMGKAAYPHLVKYIEHEDPSLGRAAVAVLNELTGQKKPLPNEATRAKSKAEWEEWVKANP